MNQPALKKAIEGKKLLAFAADILLACDDPKEAEELIEAVKSLKDHGIDLNVAKTKIIGDYQDLKNINEIVVVQVDDKLKYLGLDLVCD